MRLTACSKEKQEPSPLDGELRDVLKKSISEGKLSPDELRESDKRVMDGIASVGMEKIEEIASEVKGDLDKLMSQSAQVASEMLQEETEIMLAKYEEKQRDILAGVEKEKEVIKREAERIEELTREIKASESTRTTTAATKALSASTALFGLAALFYAWNGIVYSDSVALQSAVVDSLVAAASGFFLAKQNRKA